jgi:hypothetical protein
MDTFPTFSQTAFSIIYLIKTQVMLLLFNTAAIDPDYIKNTLKGSDAMFRAATAILDWVTMDERAQVNGIVGILDLTGYGLQHKLVIHTTDNVKRFTSILPVSTQNSCICY